MPHLDETKEFFNRDTFAVDTTGIQLIEAANEFAKCILNLKPKHMNANNSVMGGVIFTLADFTFAVAANAGKPLTVTLASQISFLRPAKGKQLIAEAICLNEGNRTCFYLVEVHDELGTHIATATSNGYVIEDSP